MQVLKILAIPVLEQFQRPKQEICNYMENKILILVEKFKADPNLAFEFLKGLPLSQIDLVNFFCQKSLLEFEAIQAAFSALKQEESFISFLLMIPRPLANKKAFLILLDNFSLKFDLELFEKGLSNFNPWADFKNYQALNENQIQKIASFIEKLLESNLVIAMYWLDWSLSKVSFELKNIALNNLKMR